MTESVKVGSRIKDNDPRMKRRIFTDGKPRRSGFDLIPSPAASDSQPEHSDQIKKDK